MTKITRSWLLGCLLGLVLVSTSTDAGFNWFGNNKADSGKKDSNDPSKEAPTSEPSPIDKNQPAMVGDGEVGGGSDGDVVKIPRRIDLNAIRAAKNELEDLTGGLSMDDHSMKPAWRGHSSGKVQGRTRRNELRSEQKPIGQYLDDDQGFDGSDDESEVDDFDEDDEVQDTKEEVSMASLAGGLFGRKSKDNRVKYVATKRTEEDKEARQKLLSRISYQRAPQQSKDESDREEAKKKSGTSLTSKKFWGKKLNGAVKATNKGLKATMKGLAELPKDIGNAVDSVSAYLQLDGRGKILSLIQDAEGASKFVRKEFSKFTLDWSPTMELALDYLGDKNLNKITWNDSDELDLRRDALHSIVFGLEFMRLMIIWRENLLLAHEGFKFWLEGLKQDYDRESLNIDKDLEFSPAEVHNYMLLMAWDSIQYDSLEPRLNLQYLMEIEDAQPKNYESVFFRKIVDLQEMYMPTIQEIDNERAEVKRVVEDQDETATFFLEFREMVAKNEIKNVDVLVPQELSDFMAMLMGQIHNTQLVYDKSYLKSLAEELAAAAKERQALMEESNGKNEQDESEQSA